MNISLYTTTPISFKGVHHTHRISAYLSHTMAIIDVVAPYKDGIVIKWDFKLGSVERSIH
jgi:hypothetical protein